MGENEIDYKEYEDFYGGNLDRSNYPSLGLVETVHDSVSPQVAGESDNLVGRVSGRLMDLRRDFGPAFVLMPGGADWGVSIIPRPGDFVLVFHSANNVAFAMPFSGNYAQLVVDGNTADYGFKPLAPGEIHAHSRAHAETLMDSMGNWSAYDAVGDSVQLDAGNGTLRMRAWHQSYQYYGFDEKGVPGVTIAAGMTDIGGSFYHIGDDGETIAPNASTYHVKCTGDIIIEGPNGAKVCIKDNGISIEPGTNPETKKQNKVSIGGGRFPVLYSKLPFDSMSITGVNQIGVSDFVTVGGTNNDMLDGMKRNDFNADTEDPTVDA